MENKEVVDAFNKASTDYDKYRKQAIPNMDIYYNTVVNLTKNYSDPKILDLGAGTGILTELLYKQHPNSNITLVDLSTEMLNIAKNKFNDKNFKYIEADYLTHDFDKDYDIIVSSLSIHHLTDEEKKVLYKRIYNFLRTGGVFINADQVCGATEYTEEIYKKEDASHLNRQNIPEKEKDILRQRRLLDKPAKLLDTIQWYEDIGYKNVDVYYKYYRYFVIAGEK
ncbi:MAG: class I SAM-dependent methyltransferase [Methanosphaera sp.]|uniref:class I SAM-dependent methyltransferase n=1 Tax=Methanosphaera sp. TaxID=2666342 RepID=UPI002E7A33B6|nr:class I SAM-dependent methyltransferase [Methanosphaera sp.]MEE1116994.1 class I SAM-dependent methyltransferase [Methanosphaera sp.]MEE3324279.1 class I SAM-dependent methyltransferase [Methanosphaera sp.]MEE3418020.1 class I SAM-dependent methyltransferase [Methanosphaera sp.]